MLTLFRTHLLMAFFLLPALLLAENFKTESINSLPESLSAGLSASLQKTGIKIVNQAGNVWCELWLRKELPNATQPAGANAKYPNLHTGLLVGIMHFPADASDYRGQIIKPGVYSLRYALIPQDGNHMGVSPIRDFLLLTPVSEDSSGADAEIGFNDLMAMSRKTTGTNHPAVILMAYPPESLEGPSLYQDDLEHWVYKAQFPLRPSGNLILGIIVYGKSEG
jgi:hypothetical protein